MKIAVHDLMRVGARSARDIPHDRAAHDSRARPLGFREQHRIEHVTPDLPA
jgi:hypothetical protein